MSQENINQELRNILNEVGYNVTTEELAELNDNELEAIFGGFDFGGTFPKFEPPVSPMYGMPSIPNKFEPFVSPMYGMPSIHRDLYKPELPY